jgi:hypothetical protein
LDRRQIPRSRRRPRQVSHPSARLRFSFYGRISTEDFQDRHSSLRWQRAVADDLVAGHGTIVAEFFDIGYSRRPPWADRPQAAALLAAFADPGREFDAVVVGEIERAFYGNQYTEVASVFERYGVQLWLPELDGPVDHHHPTHQALMMLLGVQSKREVLRSSMARVQQTPSGGCMSETWTHRERAHLPRSPRSQLGIPTLGPRTRHSRPDESTVMESMKGPDPNYMIKYCNSVLPDMLTTTCGIDPELAHRIGANILQAGRSVRYTVHAGTGRADHTLR